MPISYMPKEAEKPKPRGLFERAFSNEEDPEEVAAEQKAKSELGPLLAKERKIKAIESKPAYPSADVAPIVGRTKISYMPRPDPIQETKETKGIQLPGQHYVSGTDVVNFLAGGEMAVIGMKLDTEGFSWEWENMKQQWSEEPLWLNLLSTTSLVGSMAFPAARAAWVTAKFGQVGKMLPKVAVPLLGKIGGVASDAEEIAKFTHLGMVEKGAKVASKDLRLLRQQEYARAKYLDLAAKMELDKGKQLTGLNVVQRMKFEFDKRFANQFFQIANSFTEGTGWRAAYHANLDALWKSENVGKYFVDLPDAKDGPKVMQYYLHRLSPGAVPNPKLDPKLQMWADNTYAAHVAHQQEALAEGLIDEATFKKIGEAHIPALYKETPTPNMDFTRSYLLPLRGKKEMTKASGLNITEKEPSGLGKLFGGGVKYSVEAGEDTKYIAISSIKIPRLDSDTFKMRKSDLPEVYRKLVAGELITDPADLTVRGYVMDRLLLHNHKVVRDLMMDPRYAVSNFDIMTKYKTADAARKAGYVNFETVGEGISTRLKRMVEKKGGKLGPEGELPWVRKEIFEEIFGETGMFAQTSVLHDAMELATVIHKASKTGLSIPTHFQNVVGNMVMLMQAGFHAYSPENIKIQHSMAQAFNKIAHIHKEAKAAGYNTRAILDNIKVNLGHITVDGKKFSLNDELLHPMVRELIEESAFENVEGLAHVEKLTEQLKQNQYLTRAMANTFLKVKSLSQLGDKKGFRWFDQMTKWYLGEDMVPKMSYYMKLRAKGLTREAAVLEVGRRLPMYGTVGSAIKLGRKWAFPWASFPTEALRITKNNIMDNPLRMAPWLHAPQIMQTLLAASDPTIGSPEEVEEAKRGLPMYAQKPTTVISGTEASAGVGGAISGGVAGAIGGGVVGGLPGAIIGGAAGAFGGKEVSEYLSDDSKGDVLRGSILNWLPHSSFFLTTNSPDYTLEGGPFETLQQVQEQLPAEPLAILKPLLDIAAGKTNFGADIGATGLGDQFGKAVAGAIGFLAPPWIQKYGLKTTTPDVSFSEQFFGEAIPGDFTNVSRGLIDTGIAADPITGKPGNLSLDFILGNFGMWKSYGVDPKIQLANETSTDDNLERIRTTYVKNLDYNLQNGEDDRAMDILTKVMATFSRQYADNPKMASEKYGEWLDRLTKSMGKHPRLRKWSEDELKDRRKKALEFSGNERMKTREALVKAIGDELHIRRISASKKKSESRNRPKEKSRLLIRERT